MIKRNALFVLLIFNFLFSYSQTLKENLKKMMNNNSINFYDVVSFAEKNYSEELKKTKGSGWKPYLRWKAENEYKFYPSGNRNQIDYFAKNKIFDELKQKATSQKMIFNNGWEELGPSNIGNIAEHYSVGLGRIVSFYINPANTNQMYLGSRTGGFWKSTNGGSSWSGGASDFLPAAGVTTIDVKPIGTNTGKVLINVNNSENHISHGIYQSTDNGDSFSPTSFIPSNLGWGGLGLDGYVSKIKYHPTITNLIFIATSKGLYRSTDDLTTTNWSTPVNNSNFTDIDFHPTDPNIIYAYSNDNPNRLYVSNNQGISFSTTNISGNTGSVGKIQVSNSCADCVYFFSGNGYFKSINKGNTFTQISTPNLSSSGFAVSDLNDNNLMAGYVDAHFSNNGGTSFNQVTNWNLSYTNGYNNTNFQNSYNNSTNYIHADLQEAQCINGVFYACTDGYLVKSENNGQDWILLSKEGVGIRMNYNLGVSQSNHYRTICGSQDNGTSVNTENGWVEMFGADGMEGIIHPLNDDWMIGSYQYGGRIQTKDAGYGYESITPGGSSNYWIAPIVYDPNDHMTLYHFGRSIYKSTDFGESWVTLGTPSFNDTVKFATIAENNSNILVATSYEKIELSEDGGSTFTDIKGTLPNQWITDVVFDPNNDNTIVVTYGAYWNDGNKIFISHDRGNTWNNITHNLGNMPIRSVVIDHTNNSNIYLGAEIGIYKMPMNGATWSLYNQDLPNVTVKELDIVYGSNTLRASTWGRGLWEFTLDNRTDYPSIVKTEITTKPTLNFPMEGEDQFITSEILYDNTLTNVEVRWSVNSQNFNNTIQMSQVSENTWKSNTPIPSQLEGDKVYFKVIAEGSNNDISETYKFMYNTHEYKYCEASGESVNGNLFLNQVTIENISNTSTNDSYTYYSTDIINLVRNNAYNVSLNANTNWLDNDFGAWIDFNHNRRFESSELVLSSVNGSGNASNSFTVPADANIDNNLRMRVRLGFWDTPALDPCGETLGEVEDYLVKIKANPLTTNNIPVNNPKIYPNPTTGIITLDLGSTYHDVNIKILNILGQEIFSKKYHTLISTELNINTSKGIYFIQAFNKANNINFTTKIIKE